MRPTVLLISLNGGALLILGAALFMPLPTPKPAVIKSAPATVSAPQLSQRPCQLAGGGAGAALAVPAGRNHGRATRAAFQSHASFPGAAAGPTLVLRGILSDGSRWMALIEIEGEPERRLVGRGDAVGTWIVSSVAARSVTLNRRGEQRELRSIRRHEASARKTRRGSHCWRRSSFSPSSRGSPRRSW